MRSRRALARTEEDDVDFEELGRTTPEFMSLDAKLRSALTKNAATSDTAKQPQQKQSEKEPAQHDPRRADQGAGAKMSEALVPPKPKEFDSA